MNGREINIFELALLFVWFSAGYIPGAIIGRSHGVFLGLFGGFFAFIISLFLVNHIRLALSKTPSSKVGPPPEQR
jgi:hypothetical protein